MVIIYIIIILTNIVPNFQVCLAFMEDKISPALQPFKLQTHG